MYILKMPVRVTVPSTLAEIPALTDFATESMVVAKMWMKNDIKQMC